MSVGISWNLFGFVIHFSSSEKFLSVWILIKNNSEACCHVHNLSACVVKYVLTRIWTTITIHILKFIGCIWWGFVYCRMIFGLNYSTNPRFYCHEFFLLYLTLDNHKDINLVVINKFSLLASFFVYSYTYRDILLSELWRLSPSSGTLRLFWLTGSHKI